MNTLSIMKDLDRSAFTPALVSGVENVFTEEARRLGVTVEIIDYPSSLTSTYRSAFGFGPVSLARHAMATLSLVQGLRRFIGARHIDIIHPCDNVSRVAGGIAAKLSGIPAVCQITDDFEDDATGRVLRRIILSTMEFIMPVSDKVGDFFRVSPEASARVRRIYTGIDLREFAELSNGEPNGRLRREFSLRSDELALGIIGSLIPIKGHRELFQALSLLKSRSRVPLRCVVIGDGPDREDLVALAGDLGLRNDIVFVGFRRDIPALLRGLDIVIAPSRSEASSRVLLEAGALKLPVIGTRVGGIPEMISEGETGLLVPCGDIEALASAVETLFDPALRRRMGEAGRRRIEDLFSNERVTRQIEDVYKAALTRT